MMYRLCDGMGGRDIVNELALFSGAGGGILGAKLLGWRTVCAVEIDPYCREVLLRRQRDGLLDLFPIWDDIRTFDGQSWRGIVDIISAGFPCQPFSVAGRRKGEDDEQNLWPETIRIIRQVRPRFCLLENVPGLLAHRYFGRILGDLAESGYDCRWDCISASSVGAPHRRDRLWIVAYSKGQDVADPNLSDEPSRHESYKPSKERWGRFGNNYEAADWWSVEPDVGRVAYGLASRVDRLRALGNGQVPAVVYVAWKLLRPIIARKEE